MDITCSIPCNIDCVERGQWINLLNIFPKYLVYRNPILFFFSCRVKCLVVSSRKKNILKYCNYNVVVQ